MADGEVVEDCGGYAQERTARSAMEFASSDGYQIYSGVDTLLIYLGLKGLKADVSGEAVAVSRWSCPY